MKRRRLSEKLPELDLFGKAAANQIYENNI